MTRLRYLVSSSSILGEDVSASCQRSSVNESEQPTGEAKKASDFAVADPQPFDEPAHESPSQLCLLRAPSTASRMTAPARAIEQKRTSKEVEMGTVDRISRRWARWVVFAGVKFGLVLSIADGLTARAACQTVRGKFTIQIVTGPECQAPAGLCGIGTYIGGLSGASDVRGVKRGAIGRHADDGGGRGDRRLQPRHTPWHPVSRMPSCCGRSAAGSSRKSTRW